MTTALHINADRLLDYDLWANGQTLESLRQGDVPQRAREIFAHILAAQRLWLARIRNEPATIEVWPQPDLARADDDLQSLRQRWRSTLTNPDILGEIEYRNSRGELWRSALLDIITHVALHGAYHRGQIAICLGRAGLTAAYTDFIHAARQGAV